MGETWMSAPKSMAVHQITVDRSTSKPQMPNLMVVLMERITIRNYLLGALNVCIRGNSTQIYFRLDQSRRPNNSPATWMAKNQITYQVSGITAPKCVNQMTPACITSHSPLKSLTAKGLHQIPTYCSLHCTFTFFWNIGWKVNFPEGISEVYHIVIVITHHLNTAELQGNLRESRKYLIRHTACSVISNFTLSTFSLFQFVDVQFDRLQMLPVVTRAEALWKAFCSSVSTLLNICGNRSGTCFYLSHLRSNLCGSYLADSYRWPRVWRLMQMMNEWVCTACYFLYLSVFKWAVWGLIIKLQHLYSLSSLRTLCSD